MRRVCATVAEERSAGARRWLRESTDAITLRTREGAVIRWGMVAGMLIGFAMALAAVVIGFVLGRRSVTKEHARSLQSIESRLVVLQDRVERWMKAATTLTQPVARIDPRREPE